MLDKVDQSYQAPILSSLLENDKIEMQLVITEAETDAGIPIYKSKMFYLKVLDSINAQTEEPEEYPEWIDEANAKLAELQASITTTTNLARELNALIEDIEEKLDAGEFKGETGDSVTNAGINSNGELIITVGGVN